jgi:hypothetical protein
MPNNECGRMQRTRVAALLGAIATLLGSAVAEAQLLPPPTPNPNPPPQDPAQEPAAPGLAPPAPVIIPEDERATFQQLERADREDAGRGLQFVWIAPDVGFQWVGLDALSNSDLIDERVSAGMGPAFGGTLGARWLYYTFGARFRYSLLNEFSMWTAGGDFALRIPLGSFEPYGFIGAGYLQAQDFAAGDELRLLGATADLQMSGLNARLGGGFDYYVTPVFSTGVSIDAEAMFLSRDALPGSDDADAAFSESVYAVDGSAIGLSVTAMAVLGLHF